MRKERVILSFIALLIGLAVAGGAFYLYQQTGSSEQQVMSDKVVSIPTPTPEENPNLLQIEKPQNEDVITSKTVTLSGKALPDTTIVVQSGIDDQVAITTANGNFQTTVEIEDGLNILNITALYPDGTEKSEQRVITYSQEDF